MPENILNDKGKRIQINIIDQKMRVTIRINPPAGDEDTPMIPQDVLYALQSADINFGYKYENINEYLDGKKWGDLLVAAEGIYPGVGEDAKLEYFFHTTKSLRPRISEDGRIDYKEVDLVGSVNKDDILIKKIPATKGLPGKNVFGDEVPGKSGKDIIVTAGQGTTKDPDDPMIIKAAVDGIISYDPKTNIVEVQKLYVIPGSVDFSTGNVNVKSSVDIKGDVKSGFTVTTPYNITVKGLVEHASISCDGVLSVRGGIVGDGQQLIKVGGDLHTGYIRNQKIKCRGSIFVATEILSSNIECEDEVTLVKPDGKIVGGKVIASNKVTASVIGNKYDVPTEIEVGMNFEHREKYLKKLEQVNEAHKAAEEIKKKIEVLNSRPPDMGTNARYKSLREQHQAALEQWERMAAELKLIEKDYYNVENPTIRVSKSIYSGVTVKIKHAAFEVKNELNNVVFKLNGDQIEYSKMT